MVDINFISAASSLIGYTRSLTNYDILKSEDGWVKVPVSWVNGLGERADMLQEEIDKAFKKNEVV